MAKLEFGRPASRPKRVALIATEIRKYSHAQHFVEKPPETFVTPFAFLRGGFGWSGWDISGHYFTCSSRMRLMLEYSELFIGSFNLPAR